MKTNQEKYIPRTSGYQLCLPIDTEKRIPEDAPVVMLNAVLERLDYRELAATYSRGGRIEYSPKHLFKVVVYAYYRGMYSSREIEQACRENLCFLYLLEDNKVPDHNTIDRFRRKHLSQAAEGLLVQLVGYLREIGEISFEKSAVFLDGTKIEANANRYSFVWKTGTEKNREKMWARIRKELPRMLKRMGLPCPEDPDAAFLKEAASALEDRKEQEGTVFVYGKGTRKTDLQRVLEQIGDWIGKEQKYAEYLEIIGQGRNSFSKTDHDATFMHMKEDHMRNGQLKPGYNVNVASVSEYAVGSFISSDRSDVNTLIPFLKKLLDQGHPVKRIVADSGYESEENYRFCETCEQLSLFVKPADHEISKTRKYRSDISRRENMQYDEELDQYTCAAGKKLIPAEVKRARTASGYETEKTVYECRNCAGCPKKQACIRSRSKHPLEERNKRIEVSKYFAERRKRMEKKICSAEGILLRINRSIQAEGVFAFVKEDMSFRRFLTRGKQNVTTEWTLLMIAYDLKKLYFRTKKKRLGTHLFLADSA